MSKPGFELQWKTKLDNQPRGVHGLGPRRHRERRHDFRADVARDRQLEHVYGVDNDLGYVVWQRQFDAPLPPPDRGLSRRHLSRRDAHRPA